ncbi:single-strand DNA-binding protein [Pseudonocardia eucalypti]|nr:single-strand DNA-binding protein [Pseudonocardia eucalypti]
MNETLVTLVGNVISEVSRRRVTEGEGPVYFRMASNERRFDRESGNWVDGDRFFVTVTCWRRLADGVQLSLEKGDPVIVKGRLYTSSFEAEGKPRSVTSLEAYAVGPDLSRCSARPNRPRREALEDVAAEDVALAGIPEQRSATGQSEGSCSPEAEGLTDPQAATAERELKVVTTAAN